MTTLVPMAEICLLIEAVAPAARASDEITDQTPMMMPSMARSDRSLLASRLLNEILTVVQKITR